MAVDKGSSGRNGPDHEVMRARDELRRAFAPIRDGTFASFLQLLEQMEATAEAPEPEN